MIVIVMVMYIHYRGQYQLHHVYNKSRELRELTASNSIDNPLQNDIVYGFVIKEWKVDTFQVRLQIKDNTASEFLLIGHRFISSKRFYPPSILCMNYY